ncbi:MAG: exosortase [Thermodesulfobacteriota bacterium]|jgi:exosortase
MNEKHRDALPENIWIKVGLLVGALVFAYAKVMPLLVRTWSRDDYSHGWLVPIIALYFIWVDRKRLGTLAIQPNIFWGLLLTLLGSLLLMMSNIGGVPTVQELSLIIIIPGLILMLLGTRYLMALALPLAYLILMVPILDEVIDKIHWPFQLFSARMGSGLLGIFNIPFFLRANYFELPNMTLEVAEECSGVRYLISIIAIGIPLAHFTQRGWWRKAVLVITAVIIGILSNGVRVAFVVLCAYYYGKNNIQGPLHMFQGLFVSIVGYIFLFISAWLLYKISLSKVELSHKKKSLQRVINKK